MRHFGFEELSMNPRQAALTRMESRSGPVKKKTPETLSDKFGELVFNINVMQKNLPHEVFQNIQQAMEGVEPIRPEFADAIAIAMKEWAIALGATHYSHWFQPLTGLYAEKHDAFIAWDASNQMIEKFSGKQLVQGEPDASSFPSGGLRSTYEARGYTGWDPTSPPFVWRGGDGVTLCIPSVFFSWTGEVLDTKIPLLRSDRKINKAVLRLLKLTSIPARYVYSTLGLEQEYFVIDRAFRNLRPDLVMVGRTVFGASAPKGQELQDHYFGAVKDRVLSYMSAFEEEAIKLGIPLKTRHNEVAPAQHEVAPVFEKASRAVDHNILLMELMRKVASENQLSCLLHEKPFQGINGSGKHMNWSLSTDTGVNLLDPSDTPGNNLNFILLLTAILSAVWKHAILLRASIGSASNDFRLGGHEAPPAILSVYLGEAVERLLETIEKSGFHPDKSAKSLYDLGLAHLPDLSKDSTDRNRTSPFAFTGNKFEFRALGSSASPAFSATVLNQIVAESLNEMLDEIEKHLTKTHNLFEAAIPVIRKNLMASKGIRFAGDNYSQAWVKEAKKRGLPNIHKSIYAFKALKDPATTKLFAGVLTPAELEARYEVMSDTYIQTLNIEVNLMLDIFNTQIYPAAIETQKNLAKSLYHLKQAIGQDELLNLLPSSTTVYQTERLKELALLIQRACEKAEELSSLREEALGLKDIYKEKKALKFADEVLEKGFEFRTLVDQLEQRVEDRLWPLPKYRELLFFV